MAKQTYNSNLIEFSRENRKDQTYAERKLWNLLRNKSFGVRFRRQVPISNYILDFYSPKIRMCIELDGSSHDESRYDKDQSRERDLNKLGIKVIRFSESSVMRSEKEVVETIELAVNELAKI